MAALVDPVPSWAPHCSILNPQAYSQTMDRSSLHRRRNGTPRDLNNIDSDLASSATSSTSHRQNQTMVPDTSSFHRLRVLVCCSPSAGTHPCPLPSGAPNDTLSLPPPRQLVSRLFSTPQNHLPFPSSFPLPSPPNLSAMLALLPENPLRRANKLRKSNRISTIPPRLAPLSFIEEPELDLDFEHISHDVPRPSPHPLPHSLTTFRQDVPSTHLCEHSPRRRLSKRPRTSLAPPAQAQVVPSSSGAAAAAAMTGNPAASITTLSQIPPSTTTSSSAPRAWSDVGHGLRSSVSIKRSSIIRRLSMRTPKHSLESQATSSGVSSSTGGPSTPTTLFHGATGIWSRRRGTVSELGHDWMHEDPPILPSLPLVRITSPISINMPTGVAKAPRIPSTPGRTDVSSSSPAAYVPVGFSNPVSDDSAFSRHRPKFTLEEENESEAEFLSNPPSPTTTNAGMGCYFKHPPHQNSHSAPPSRVQSAYNTQYLSPMSMSRREERTITPPPRRRWTFAMAMTDEDITDEVLVEELERMRLRKEWSGSVDDMGEIWDPDYVLFGSQELAESPREETFSAQQCLPEEHHQHNLQHSQEPSYTTPSSSLPSFNSKHHQPHRHNSAPLSGPSGTIPPQTNQQWQTAQRMLLICRELVRTERHYLASLQTLLNSETEGAPPPVMLEYVEELVNVSKSYLTQMEGNPSSWGVAAAFLAVEEAVDPVYVGWCGVVGWWFDDTTTTGDQARLISATQYRRLSKQKSGDEEEESTTLGRLRKISTWRKSFTSISDLTGGSYPGGAKRRESKGFAPPPSFSLYGNGHRHRRSSKAKRPPIRDLAILPTQRVMRYVLLYRDLLEHTPVTSPSRSLIKRAADAALRIAQKCDRAQTNSTFIVDRDCYNRDTITTTNTNNSGSAPTLSSEVNTEFHPLPLSKLDSSGTAPTTAPASA